MSAPPGWLAQRRITVSTMTVSMSRHICLLGSRAHVLSAMRLLSSLRRTLRALGGRPRAEELDPLVYFGEANLPKAYQTFFTAMYQAMLSYLPTQYEGKVVLLRAKVPTLFRSRHVTMGWETVAAGE